WTPGLSLFFVCNEFLPRLDLRHPNCLSESQGKQDLRGIVSLATAFTTGCTSVFFNQYHCLLKPRIAKPAVRSARVAGSGTVDTGTPLISTAKFPLGVIQAPPIVHVWKTPPLRSANPSESSEEIGGPGLTANGT